MIRTTIDLIRTVVFVLKARGSRAPESFQHLNLEERLLAASLLRDYVQRKRSTLQTCSDRMPAHSIAEVSDEIRFFLAAADLLDWLNKTPHQPVTPEIIDLRARNQVLESARFDVYEKDAELAKVRRQLEGASKEVAYFTNRIGELMALYQGKLEAAGLEVDAAEFQLYPHPTGTQAVPHSVERVADLKKLPMPSNNG